MQAMPTMSSQDEDDTVVCTPDLPMDTEEEEEEEPVVTSKPDDDVQCLTPTPKIVPKPLSALTEPKPRQYPAVLPSTAFSNIIQMTENDVTINEVTGGLKFKVDPSTLSSSKMYKLPDGRIFAVNNNPNMPGGYSATIVAIDEASLARSGVAQGRSQRLQQRLQRQNKPGPSQPPKLHSWTTPVVTKKGKAVSSPRIVSSTSLAPTKSVVDNNAPAGSVEWFKFNVVDAIDIMNYVLQKLNKIKSSSQELRTKSISDVKDMHLNFDQTLKTSCKRFEEVRETLNSGYKNWLKEKNCTDIMSDDEDEVQILQTEESQVKKPTLPTKPTINDEPIFIDENSNDSNKNNSGEGDVEDASCELLDDTKVEENSTKEDETSVASSKAEADGPENLTPFSSTKTAAEPEFVEDIGSSENGDKSDEKEKDVEDPLNTSEDINKETEANEVHEINKETEESSSGQDKDEIIQEIVESADATTPDASDTPVAGETEKDDERDSLSNVDENTSTMDENTSNVDDNTNTSNTDDILSNGKHSPDKNGEMSNSTEPISKATDDSMGEDIINKLLYDSEPMEVDSGIDELKKLENTLSDNGPSGEAITTDVTE